jgi:hypothetical protein
MSINFLDAHPFSMEEFAYDIFLQVICCIGEINMQIRRFSADLKTKIPGSHTGLYGVPVQLDSAHLFTP